MEGKVAQLTTGLNQRLAVLGEREQQVAAIDSQLKERTAAMETVDQHLSDATAALNRRLGIIADREREQVDIERALEDLDKNRARARPSWRSCRVGSTSGSRCLASASRRLADYETKARLAAYKVGQLQTEAADGGAAADGDEGRTRPGRRRARRAQARNRRQLWPGREG